MLDDINKPIPSTIRHERALEKQSRILKRPRNILDKQTRILDEHSRKLDEHTFDIRRLGILREESRRETKFIVNVVLVTHKRFDRFEYLDEKVIHHENRLCAIESFIRTDLK